MRVTALHLSVYSAQGQLMGYTPILCFLQPDKNLNKKEYLFMVLHSLAYHCGKIDKNSRGDLERAMMQY